MKWETYKLLSKEEREEYNFRFGTDKIEFPSLGLYVVMIGLLSFSLLALAFMLALDSPLISNSTIILFINRIFLYFKVTSIILIAELICYILIQSQQMSNRSKWFKQHLKTVRR